jgi:hypothetical protein
MDHDERPEHGRRNRVVMTGDGAAEDGGPRPIMTADGAVQPEAETPKPIITAQGAIHPVADGPEPIMTAQGAGMPVADDGDEITGGRVPDERSTKAADDKPARHRPTAAS